MNSMTDIGKVVYSFCVMSAMVSSVTTCVIECISSFVYSSNLVMGTSSHFRSSEALWQ